LDAPQRDAPVPGRDGRGEQARGGWRHG
jgi:hypothetical protein